MNKKDDDKTPGNGKRRLLKKISESNYQPHRRKRPMTTNKSTSVIVKKQPGSRK